MLRYLLDKFKEGSGPLKDTRQAVGDVVEELLDVAEHYIHRLKKDIPDSDTEIPTSDAPPPPSPVKASKAPDSPEVSNEGKPVRPKTKEKSTPKRTLDIPAELASAVEIASNRKKQEFKVLAILWDANNRDMGNLSAKQLSDHGRKLGLEIRHENIRKVIRMRLENYVDIHQDRRQGHTLYNYRITEKGTMFFKNKYLSS